ncbi:MAG: hypothetical protein IBX64_07835 [Actinobacteria bacterium]|nr:hypothetical protein [Actinomycetota bacterium]
MLNSLLGRRKPILIMLGIVAVFLCITLISPMFVWAQSTKMEQKPQKKVVVLVLDSIGWDDINSAELPNFEKLIAQSYTGLMNIKTRGISKVNRESGYLSLGVGVRANAPTDSGQDVVSNETGEIRVNSIDTIRSLLQQDLPNNNAGQLGLTAKELGLKVALLGNADTIVPHRDTALIAMDENGVIPFGNVSEELLINDDNFPGGIRTNEDALFKELQHYLPRADILFVDFGDTARIDEQSESITDISSEQNRALMRVDSFLGQLIEAIDEQNAMLIVVVPNTSKASINNGNTSLTPVIIKTASSDSGSLSSNTTKREGLVANIDFAPTIFDYLVGAKGEFIGEPITFKATEESTTGENDPPKAQKNEKKLQSLRWSRLIAHGICVILIVISLFLLYVPPVADYFRVTQGLKHKLVATTFTYILTVFTIGPLLTFLHFITESIAILLISAILNLLMIKWLQKIEYVLMAASLATSLTILSYLFFAPAPLHNSPLGFNEVFHGVRYYGISNDAMGILIGSSLIGTLSLAQWLKTSSWNKKALIIGYSILVVLSLTPPFGANVGGTIAAMSVVLLLGLALFTKGVITWRRVLLVVGLVFITEIAISYLDALLNDAQTHAGKAVKSLTTSNFTGKLVELLLSKLRLFGLMILIPPYNIILASEMAIFLRLLKKKGLGTKEFQRSFPHIYQGLKVFFYGGLIAFAFNDTGVIAAAYIFTYFLLPYGILREQGMERKGSVAPQVS